MNNIFWHIYALNNWKDIVNDQLSTIINSNLLSIVDNIYITFIGSNSYDIEWLTQIDSKIILQNYSTNPKEYEKLCLHSLVEWSKAHSSNILYIHTKGVTHLNNSNVWNWRKMMEYFLIEKHTECLSKLDEGFDAVGCLLTNVGNGIKIKDEDHQYHFSGNFWWSKTDYLKLLPKIPEVDLSINNNYWLTERLILYHYPNMKIHLMYDNKTKHYYRSSPLNYR